MSIAPLLLLASLLAPPQDDAATLWTDDVLHVVAESERMHPDPFFGCPREAFEEAIDAFLGGVEERDEYGNLVELMRLIATLSRAGRDGHTLVWPMQARYLPVRVYRFDDGWFVVDGEGEGAAWIGARLVALGGTPIEDACARLDPLVKRDNEWNVSEKLVLPLVCGEILHGAGIVPDAGKVALELERDGERQTIELATRSKASHELFGRPVLPAPASGGPIWLQGRDQHWRMQVLAPERALYVQYNQVQAQDPSGRTLADFAAEMVRTFEERELARLVIDVRANGGGNNGTFGPLIAALQSPALAEPGVLFALIGRHTFSAAGNFVTVLECDTTALLVGEPTGGAPNQYGDAKTIALPNHPSILVRCSTRYHEFAAADDARLTHEPHLAVPLRSEDWFAGRDPVLEAALAYTPPR
jgi:hypothetical protein